MNWVLILVILILAGFMYKGMKKGLIKTVLSMCSIIVGMGITIFLSPMVNQAICNNNDLVNGVASQVNSALHIQDSMNKNVAKQNETISKLPLPENIKTEIQKNNTKSNYQTMLVDNFSSYISKYIAFMILHSVGFICVYIIIHVILKILIRVLDLVNKFPVVHEMNELAGLLLGLIEGCMFLWIGCILLTVFSASPLAQQIYQSINDSSILTFIYSNNLLLRVVIQMIGGAI